MTTACHLSWWPRAGSRRGPGPGGRADVDFLVAVATWFNNQCRKELPHPPDRRSVLHLGCKALSSSFRVMHLHEPVDPEGQAQRHSNRQHQQAGTDLTPTHEEERDRPQAAKKKPKAAEDRHELPWTQRGLAYFLSEYPKTPPANNENGVTTRVAPR